MEKQTNNNDGTYSPAKTVVKALNIIEFIGQNQPVGVAEISKAMNLTRANAHRLVTTLESLDFIDKSTITNTRCRSKCTNWVAPFPSYTN